MVLLGLTVILAMLFRRSFCGLLCPFGALQELFGKLRQTLSKRRFIIHLKVDRVARYLKYTILLLTLGMAWYYGSLWMAPYDPYSAYSHLSLAASAIEEAPFAIIGFALLFITLVGSFLYDRFFCKHLCPVGAFYTIIGKISPTKIERNDNLYAHCQKCNNSCSVNIDIQQSIKITDAECINCNECVLTCPQNGALEVKTARKTVHPIVILALVFGIFFGTIFVAQLSGNFEILPPAIAQGEIVPIYEVKGYNTIEDAAILSGLTPEEVYKQLGIPEGISKSTQFKNISAQYPDYSFDEAKANAGGSERKSAVTEPLENIASSEKIDVSGIKGSMTIQEAF